MSIIIPIQYKNMFKNYIRYLLIFLFFFDKKKLYVGMLRHFDHIIYILIDFNNYKIMLICVKN